MTSTESSEVKFTVMIQGPTEQFYEFSLPADTDVTTLKMVVEAQSNIKSSDQQLYHKNKFISNDSDTLQSLNVHANDVILVKPANANRIDLSMPTISPFADIPAMPKWLSMDQKELQQSIRSDSVLMQQLLHQNPTFAQALLSEDTLLLSGYLQQLRTDFNNRVQREQYRRAQLNADPLNPEYQAQIFSEMKQENINQNYATAVEEMPEAFGRVVMLYVPMQIEGVHVTAFIDSGAQSTIMSKEYAEKCNLMRLVDKRFSGIAKGVGTAKIIGRVHIAKIKFGNIYLPSSFTIIDQQGMDFLFGLDMLRRHQGVIDLHKGVLRIGDEEVSFLQEKDIPHLKEEEANAQAPQAMDEDAALQNALLQSTQQQQQQQQQQQPSQSQSHNHNHNTNANANANANVNANGSNDLMATILGAMGGNNNGGNGGSNVNNRNASALNQNDIDTLSNLGYTQQQAIQALTACGGNVEMAASFLFSTFGGGLGF